MKKIIKTSIGIFLILLIAISCKKEEAEEPIINELELKENKLCKTWKQDYLLIDGDTTDAETLANYATSFIANKAINKATTKFPSVYESDGLGAALKKTSAPSTLDAIFNVTWNAICNPIYKEHIKPNLTKDPILIVPPTNGPGY